jgi:adenosylmethionine-8-amino-7-oxononanoate aminotransferase
VPFSGSFKVPPSTALARATNRHTVARVSTANVATANVDRPRLSASGSVATADLRRLDRAHVWHPFTPMSLWHASDPLVITAADGMHLIDSDGHRYLDGVSSLWCNVHGHRVPEIDQAIRDQLGKVAHTTMLGLASEPAILLAERLVKLAPPGLTKVFYSDAGATATEVAFKLAAQYWFNVGRPQKCEFVGFAEAYHGDTVGAMSVGRVPAFHKPYFPMLFKTHFAPTPFVYRYPQATPAGGRAVPADGAERAEAVRLLCLAALDSILREHGDRIAAVCIEPMVQGAGGMIVQPPGFLAEVARLAKAHDVLLIADEVAVGFGRTGRMFACEHENVRPDLMCVAKGITGGYLPLAATLATQAIFDAFLGDPWEGRTFYHGHTYTGNPLACAAALASLDLFERNRVVEHVAATAAGPLARMLDELRELPHVGDVRQLGYMVGIELVADKATKEPFDPRRRVGAEVCLNCRKHGVIIRPLGDVVVLMPPPAMGVDDLRTIVDAVKEEVATLTA